MKVQIINDIVLAFGIHLFGPNIYDAPDDYSFETYNYIPEIEGIYNINNFIKIENNE
jgi:hypothetical protein